MSEHSIGDFVQVDKDVHVWTGDHLQLFEENMTAEECSLMWAFANGLPCLGKLIEVMKKRQPPKPDGRSENE